MYPESLQRLLAALEELPGVGPRSAERYAFHLLKADAASALRLADAIRDLKRMIAPCSRCGAVTEEDPCSICRDPARDQGVVLVVEQPKDLYALERLGLHRGVYCVLMGQVALLDGVDEQNLNLAPLFARLDAGSVREVILALSPNLEGDTTALHLIERLRGYPVRISRIARGVGAGTTLADAPRAVLEDALADRRPVQPGRRRRDAGAAG